MNYNIIMKMKFFVKSVLCLVMLTSLCCSCSDDSESREELDAPTGEVLPKTDQLSVKLNLPTAVLGNNFKEAGSALVNRLTKNVSINDNSVRVVVLDNETALTIDGDMLEKVKQVYDKGGVIAITEPSNATMERLKKYKLGDALMHDYDDDGGNGHFNDIYAFNKKGGEMHLEDLNDSDEAQISSVVIKEDGDTTRTELAEANLSQEHTPYTYGLFADAVATWIEKQAVVSETNTNGGSNDIHSMTKAQTITYIYYPTYPGHDKAKGRSALYQVTYTIYAVYSFDQNMDYYMVHQEILGNNSTMMLSDKWKENKGTCYGFYLGEIDNDHEIFKPNGGSFSPTEVFVHDPRPATSEGSYSTTSGYSVDFGGNIGLDTSGPSAGFSAGGSISESYTMNVSDVTITNKSLDGGSGRARWNYDVADAPVTSNGFKAKMHEAPLVSRNTINLHNCWYWTVKNPAAYSGQFRVKAVNRVFFEYSWLRNKVFTYSWCHYLRGKRYTQNIWLKAPNRTKK